MFSLASFPPASTPNTKHFPSCHACIATADTEKLRILGASPRGSLFFISPFGEASVCDELNRFIRAHRIVNIEKRLIDGERGTGWLFLIEYGNEAKSQPTNAQRIDYREVLNEQEYALFDRLRDVRKTISEKQGVPVYAVFTNEQLAAMVKKPPLNLKDILALPGVGEARVKQYGEAFLKVFPTNTGVQNETPKSSL